MKTQKNHPLLKSITAVVSVTLVLFLSGQTLNAVTWLNLDTSQSIGQANPSHYGMNLNLAMNPDKVVRDDYQDAIAYMNCKFVRYHAAEQIIDGNSRSWINGANQSWDSNRINTCLSNLDYSVNAKLITITKWPSWMDTNNDGRLDNNKFNAYADFCANLVDIVNNQQGHGVKYWEPFNEVEAKYPNDVETLADIFNRCAQKMKAKDSSIKLVGGAWTQPWSPIFPGTMGDFLAEVKGNIDVCSYHQYGTGNGSLSPSQLYDTIDTFVDGVDAVQDRLNSNGMGNIPIWLSEHNIFWTWESDSQGRMVSITGGVFDALLLTRLLRQGKVDGAFSWLDADTRYGKVSFNYSTWKYDRFNAGSHVYALFNQFGTGQLVQSGPSSGNVQALGIKDTSRNLITYVVINRSNTSQSIFLGNSNQYNWVESRQITSNGLNTTATSSLQWKSLPAHSVTFFLGGLGSSPPDLGSGGNNGGGSGGDFQLELENFDRSSSKYTVSGGNALIDYNSPNSWGEYDGQSFSQGNYDLTLRYGSHWGGMNISVKVGGQTVATFNNLAKTWNINTFREETLTNISIPAGSNQTVRIEVEDGSVQLDYLKFDKR